MASEVTTKRGKAGKVVRGGIVGILIAAVVIIALGFNSFMEYLDNDSYAVHQNAFTGDLTVWNNAGWHVQMFGKVVKFKKANDIYLSADELDGGSGQEVQPVSVLFPDGNAAVDIVCRYELSLIDDIQKELYIKYGNPQAVHNMIRQQVIESVKSVGPLMSSSEAYSDRKPEVAILARTMALDGIYASHITIDTTYDTDSNYVFVKRYSVKMENGSPVITKVSILGDYGIVLPVFNVKDMAFDDKTVELIEARKDAQLSKQAAITAYQNGLSRVATEDANQDVLTATQVGQADRAAEVARIEAERDRSVAVTQADKLREVAIENLETERLNAQAIIVTAEAKEIAIRRSGALTETRRYELDIEKDIAIGVEAERAKRPVPGIVMGGSGGDGGSGLESAVLVGILKELNMVSVDE